MEVYKLIIDDTEETGMEAISLVKFPAVEVNFLTFKKDNEIQQLFFNEQKKEIYGVVCLADTPIYRFNKVYGEHYIVFDKETIKKMVFKYSKNNLINNINIEHDGNLIGGLTMVESFLKDTENGINPIQFKDVTEGSWICRFKVENDAIWQLIKDGTVKGFSLEGFFKYEEEKKEQEIQDWLDELLNNL